MAENRCRLLLPTTDYWLPTTDFQLISRSKTRPTKPGRANESTKKSVRWGEPHRIPAYHLSLVTYYLSLITARSPRVRPRAGPKRSLWRAK
jgi:hypothetical protein